MTSVRPGGPKKAGPVVPAWQSAADNLLILTGVVLVLSLCFLAFVLLTGQLSAPIIQGTALEALERTLHIWRRVFFIALWVLVLAGMARHYRVDSVGWLVVLAGVGCWWLLPMVVRSKAVGGAHDLMVLADSLMASFQATGGALIGIGILRVVVGRAIAIAYAPRRATASRLPGAAALAEIAEERARARPSLMRKCWELHFCRGSMRVTCPRFIEGVSCWKRRSGCYCDQDLATRLLSTIAAKHRVQVAEELQSAQSRAQAYQRSLAAQRSRQRQKKAKSPCRECPLYLEHQKFKYRTLSWLAYPGAAALVAVMLPPLRAAYDWLETTLGAELARMQILPDKLTADPLPIAPWLSAENAMIFMFGVLLLAILLQLLELAVFHFKW